MDREIENLWMGVDISDEELAALAVEAEKRYNEVEPMEVDKNEEDLVVLPDEVESLYRESNSPILVMKKKRSQNVQYWIDNTVLLDNEAVPTDVDENLPVGIRPWSDDSELAIPELNEVQYGEGRRPRQRAPLFEVVSSYVREYKIFDTTGTCYNLKIADPDPKVVPEKWLRELLENIINYFKNNSSVDVRPFDRIGMSLKNTECGTDPIYISIRRADQLSVDVILESIMNIFDSNKEFFLNGHLTVHFDHIRMEHGSGGVRINRKLGQSNVDFINKKACYLKYKNPSKNNLGDEYCLPYALVIGRAFSQFKCGKKNRKFYENFQKRFKSLRKAAERLCRQAGVVMSQLRGGCSFDEVKKFQRILTDYQIVIYNRDSIKPLYTDVRYNDKIKLNIMLHENHYNAMRSVQACFGAKYICPDCHVGAKTEKMHTCKYSCILCQSTPKCKVTKKTIECEKCNRNFYGPECFKNHLKVKRKQSVCSVKKNCPKCKSSLEKNHVCGQRKCITCEKMVDKNNHLCHMPKYTSKREPNSNYLYVMYDFETQQNTVLSEIEPNKFKHVPNLCVSQTQCSSCMDSTDISKQCSECGTHEYIYHSTDCVESLMDYLVEKEGEKTERIIGNKPKKVPKFDKIIVIAHNSSGFDAQFILKFIYDSDRFGCPSIIMNGTKIIELKVGSRIKFIDSLIYFQKPLSDLPKLFGFEGSKGYYPHFFNTAENNNYVGSLPGKKFYGYDGMKTDQRKKFDEWYDSIPSDYVFDNKKELIEYCRMDVTILRKACMKFAKDFWSQNEIDPFIDASTIAGACNKVFRSKYLKEDSIGVIPTNGYRLADNQSKSAIKWMTMLELEQNIEIHHAGRGREYSISGVGRCDGYHAPSRTIYEFHGCYWHFCECLSGSYAGSPYFEGMRLRRDATLAKEKAIREAGYILIIKRECEFTREMEEKPYLDKFLKNHPMVATEALNPRDAFYGGRTNANKLYFKSDGKTKVFYYDICSLYPFINKSKKCPIGHPVVHVGDDCLKVPWQEMDGLMKVTVSPPRNLAFPVLPSRYHKRLMFVLCNTCALKLNQCECEHNKTERQITGTWVMDEVKLAVSKGYEIVKIHEIWEYKVTQYEPETGEGGFFSGYINHFLKVKAQASDWPKWCKTAEQKDNYIKDFCAREGILLDKDKIENNPPLRAMAKLMLNSFWGRFGMRPDLIRTSVVSSGQELRDIILDPKKEIHSVLPINDSKMVVNYRIIEEGRESNNTTNVVVAAFTTAYARMELYKYIDLIGADRVLYFDTDSVIFTWKEGEVMPEVGDYLGQLTDELEGYGPGSYIIEFVSGGPKNYAFRVYSPTQDKIFVVVKVKGITLNYENSEILNFDMIKRMVIDPTIEPLELSIDGIRRTDSNQVYSTRVKKSYRINYTKRQLAGSDYSTLPYGY